jgi:hypothetical protein
LHVFRPELTFRGIFQHKRKAIFDPSAAAPLMDDEDAQTPRFIYVAGFQEATGRGIAG